MKAFKKIYRIVEIKVELNNFTIDPKDVEETDNWENGDIIYF